MTVNSGNSWMYPYQRTPMGNPYISPIYPYNTWVFMGYYPQESLYFRPISTMGTLLGVHPLWLQLVKAQGQVLATCSLPLWWDTKSQQAKETKNIRGLGKKFDIKKEKYTKISSGWELFCFLSIYFSQVFSKIITQVTFRNLLGETRNTSSESPQKKRCFVGVEMPPPFQRFKKFWSKPCILWRSHKCFCGCQNMLVRGFSNPRDPITHRNCPFHGVVSMEKITLNRVLRFQNWIQPHPAWHLVFLDPLEFNWWIYGSDFWRKKRYGSGVFGTCQHRW